MKNRYDYIEMLDYAGFSEVETISDLSVALYACILGQFLLSQHVDDTEQALEFLNGMNDSVCQLSSVQSLLPPEQRQHLVRFCLLLEQAVKASRDHGRVF